MRKFVQIIVIAISLVPLVGFGWCGAAALIVGVSEHKTLQVTLIFLGAMGIAISVGFGYLISTLSKNLVSPRSEKDHDPS